MTACEKCWSDSWSDPDRRVSHAEAYRALVELRNAKGEECTPEQQAGAQATLCEGCERMTQHQHCGVCTICGMEGSKPKQEGA